LARKKAEQSGGMEEDAERVRARRVRLGIPQAELAREARVSRTTLRAIEGGEGFQRSTLAKIERTLDELEHEAGLDVPPRRDEEDLLTIEVQLPDGRLARVITKGTAPPERVADQVAAILRKISERNG
jgi:transcriptional regulator with XRE-family HTH domain